MLESMLILFLLVQTPLQCDYVPFIQTSVAPIAAITQIIWQFTRFAFDHSLPAQEDDRSHYLLILVPQSQIGLNSGLTLS
jgi:hypothetical protein